MSLGELREAAVIATLIDRVARMGRFCGETLVQKSVFFLKELFHVPVSAAFQLYYYGPFSFDLREPGSAGVPPAGGWGRVASSWIGLAGETPTLPGVLERALRAPAAPVPEDDRKA